MVAGNENIMLGEGLGDKSSPSPWPKVLQPEEDRSSCMSLTASTVLRHDRFEKWTLSTISFPYRFRAATLSR